MSKRKKYVAHVNKAKSARAVLKDLAIGFVASGDGLRLVNTKHNRIEMAGPSIEAAMVKIRYKWTIYIAAMGRTELGKAYVKIDEVSAPYEVFKHEISGVVAKHHEALRDTVPKKQLSNVGWLALPVHKDMSEKELESIFDKLGCWTELAPWQTKLLNEKGE